MPTYLYRCSKCQKRFEFVLPTRQRNSKEGTLCECGGRLVRSLIEEMKQSATHVFVPGWFEHIDVEPVYISSREQLWQECEKRGLRPLGYDKVPKLQKHFRKVENSQGSS